MTRHEHPFHYYRSPDEIRKVQFTHRVRGLDEYEVQEYLDLLADQVHATDLEMSRLRDERDRLRLENERLRAEGQRRPVAAVSSASHPEAQPHAASLLLNAQKVADDLVEEAVRRARDMLTVARAEKNAILRNAKEEAAALLVDARDTVSSQSLSSTPLYSASQRASSSRHSATSTQSPSSGQPAQVHLSSQRTWQLDGHAAV